MDFHLKPFLSVIVQYTELCSGNHPPPFSDKFDALAVKKVVLHNAFNTNTKSGGLSKGALS